MLGRHVYVKAEDIVLVIGEIAVALCAYGMKYYNLHHYLSNYWKYF